MLSVLSSHIEQMYLSLNSEIGIKYYRADQFLIAGRELIPPITAIGGISSLVTGHRSLRAPHATDYYSPLREQGTKNNQYLIHNRDMIGLRLSLCTLG